MDSAELLNNVVNGKPEPPLPYESASAAMDELRTALAEETEVIAFIAFLGSNNMDRPPKMHPMLNAVLTDAWNQVETYKDNHGAEDVNIKTILELISTVMFASIHSKWIITANLVGAVINQVNAIPLIAKDLFQSPNARIAFLRGRLQQAVAAREQGESQCKVALRRLLAVPPHGGSESTLTSSSSRAPLPVVDEAHGLARTRRVAKESRQYPASCSRDLRTCRRASRSSSWKRPPSWGGGGRPYYLMHIITDINDSFVSIKGPTGENLNSESLKFLMSGNPKSVV